MASTFKMEPYTHRVDTSWMKGRGTTKYKLEKAGYLSATPVYGPEYMKKGYRGRKGRMTRDIIGYDASIMTRVEYQQAPAPAPATAPATTIKQEPVKQAGIGANRGRAGSQSRGNAGVSSNAFAGNIGSVNTEEQNDDVVMPYMKENL